MSHVLLRSCIVVKAEDREEEIGKNIQALDASGYSFDLPEERTIWKLVRDFAKLHQHAPEYLTIQAQIVDAKDPSVLDFLAQVCREPCRVRGDFAVLLARTLEGQRNAAFLEANRAARAIATTGLEIEENGKRRTLKGTDAALDYMRGELRLLERAPNGARLSGDMAEAARDMAEEYRKSPGAGAGAVFTGMRQIDQALGGCRPGELWIHAAYSGHLKSTFALNWAYNAAYYYKMPVLYYSLEMPYKQCRRWIGAMHSIHDKWTQTRIDLGIQRGNRDVGLDYRAIRDRTLLPHEERYWLEHVLPDLEDPSNGVTSGLSKAEYGTLHFEVTDLSKPDITVESLWQRAEYLYSKIPFGAIFIDHGSLLGARTKYTQTADRLNEAMRELKNMAVSFRRGQGIPVIALFQINREGLKQVQRKKEKGLPPVYEMYDLSYSTEAERSADVISASYLDPELAERGRALLSCIKSRDSRPFSPFFARLEWPCRRMYYTLEVPQKADPAKPAQPPKPPRKASPAVQPDPPMVRPDPATLNILNPRQLPA